MFIHPDYPEAGIQVPAGSEEDGDDPDDAVLREAAEETGLDGLRIEAYLGEQYRDMSDFGRPEIAYRRFYQLTFPGTPPETWRHGERHPSEGDGPSSFDFFWAELPDGVPELTADQGSMLSRLAHTPRS